MVMPERRGGSQTPTAARCPDVPPEKPICIELALRMTCSEESRWAATGQALSLAPWEARVLSPRAA